MSTKTVHIPLPSAAAQAALKFGVAPPKREDEFTSREFLAECQKTDPTLALSCIQYRLKTRVASGELKVRTGPRGEIFYRLAGA